MVIANSSLGKTDDGASKLLADLRNLRRDILWTRDLFLICWFGFFVPVVLGSAVFAAWYLRP